MLSFGVTVSLVSKEKQLFVSRNKQEISTVRASSVAVLELQYL